MNFLKKVWQLFKIDPPGQIGVAVGGGLLYNIQEIPNISRRIGFNPVFGTAAYGTLALGLF